MGLGIAGASFQASKEDILTTRLDYVVDVVRKHGVNWTRKNSLWPFPFATACCGIELMATGASRYDIARFGAEAMRFTPRQCDLLICAGRVAIKELGDGEEHLDEYADASTERHAAMVQRIRQRLGLSSLRYQKLDDLVSAIGLPKEKLCTYCWDGAESCGTCPHRATGE